jgi:hypothetical protein
MRVPADRVKTRLGVGTWARVHPVLMRAVLSFLAVLGQLLVQQV